MFPQFASTAASFSRATALLTRVGTDAQFYDDPETENFALLLDSKYEAEKIEGMKRLIALMSQGRDVSDFFPQVVKMVVTQSLELKKLVYIYLVHYAEKRPDEALLAINTFQKDLSDLNPLVRAWALRAMSGIRVRVVLPLVVMAVNKCARDPSQYVRRCSAHAISKIYALDREQYIDALEELICLLMNDNSPGVIGAVAASFTVVCPEKLFLWGARYQQLCELLPNVDEWGQIVLIDILLRYAVGRHGYPAGSIGHLSAKDEVIGDEPKQEKLDGKMEETLQESDSRLPLKGTNEKMKEKGEEASLVPGDTGLESLTATDLWLMGTSDQRHDEIPHDIVLLLRSTSPLLYSHNSGVVLATAGVHWLLASMANVKKTVKPLLFLLRSSTESQYVVLANITTFVKRAPSLFEAYYEDFFIKSADAEQIRAMKLEILCLLATESSIQHILQEFQAYVRDPDRQFAAKAVRAIGQCALHLQTVAKACTEGLLLLARSGSGPPHENVNEVGKEEEEMPRKEKLGRSTVEKSRYMLTGEKGSREALVVTEAVMALRVIVHSRPLENEEVLARLVRGLDHLKVPAARAIVIWMVGEFSTVGTRLPQMVPVILRYLGGTFKKEEDEAKLQILNCAAKVVLRSSTSSEPSSKSNLLILDYVLRLAAQDMSYDIRDRARMYQHLVALPLQSMSQQDNNRSEVDIADRLLDLHVQESNLDQVSSMGTSAEPDDQNASNQTPTGSDDSRTGGEDKKAALLQLAKRIFLMTKPAPTLPSLTPDRSAFVAGSMSHMVQHRAPNYRPLPTPCSIELVKDQQTEREDPENDSSLNSDDSASGSDEETSDRASSPLSSGSFYGEENGEIHSGDAPLSSSEGEHFENSQERSPPETRASSSQRRSHRTTHRQRPAQDLGPLINLSDSEAKELLGTHQSEQEQPPLPVDSLVEFGLLSAAELDSWLGSSEPSREEMSSSPKARSGYATVLIGKITVEPNVQTLLDFTNGGGLNLKYFFERSVSTSSERSLSMKLYFENRSLETLYDIVVRDAESSENSQIGSSSVPGISGTSTDVQALVSEQVVSQLEPGQTVEGKLCLYVRGHLKPAKVSILCGQNIYSVKFTPDIGALIRPAMLSFEAFCSAEARITGMHEALRRCVLIVPSQPGVDDHILRVSRAVAQRVLGCAHVSLVSTIIPISNDSALGVEAINSSGGLRGLCQRFSGEMLIGSFLCLITVTVLAESLSGGDPMQVEVMVKINCEDTVFGLSLLQELSKALNSSD